MKYNCVILEDEPIAADILAMYLQKDSEFKVVQICNDAFQAHTILKQHRVDLLFLDLNLPVLKGFDFLRKLEIPPKVIVTTAYHEHAIEAFALDVVDYLLKPIAQDRFQEALQKFKHLHAAEIALIANLEQDHFFVNNGKKQIKIILNSILFIESFREYCSIHTKSDIITVKMPLSKLEAMLDTTLFARVHKSYIVSLEKIRQYSASEICIATKKIPIGRTYKSNVPFLKN